jgi:hypothetical protein
LKNAEFGPQSFETRMVRRVVVEGDVIGIIVEMNGGQDDVS